MFSKSVLLPLGPVLKESHLIAVHALHFNITYGPVHYLGISYLLVTQKTSPLNYLPKLSRLKKNAWNHGLPGI